MNLLDLFLVAQQLPRHHGHDPLEPTLVDARHVPRVDSIVDVVIIPENVKIKTSFLHLIIDQHVYF